MKNHILIAGIATLMLASCAQKNQTELTLSGLNPTKFHLSLLLSPYALPLLNSL